MNIWEGVSICISFKCTVFFSYCCSSSYCNFLNSMSSCQFFDLICSVFIGFSFAFKCTLSPKDWTNEGGTYLKRVGSASQKDITFQWNVLIQHHRKKDGKTKMFHISSPYFLDLFFRFSLNFPNVKNSNCFHHRSTDVCKHTGKGKTFYSNEFFLCKNTWISCTASASTDPRLRLCGTQTHLFSVATKVCDAKCFFCSYPRKKCHGNPKGTFLVRRFPLGQLETDGWPALRTLRQLILHPPWTQTYSLRMFSIGS